MAKARLDFILVGAGWAQLKISGGAETHVIDGISYLTNALDDLLRMGIDIATDKGWSFAQFDHEPSSTVFVAETGWWHKGDWKEGARLSAFAGEEAAGSTPTWRTIYEAERDFIVHVGTRDELASLFLDMGRRVLDEYGPEGYKSQWTDKLGFPFRALAALEAALETKIRC